MNDFQFMPSLAHWLGFNSSLCVFPVDLPTVVTQHLWQTDFWPCYNSVIGLKCLLIIICCSNRFLLWQSRKFTRTFACRTPKSLCNVFYFILITTIRNGFQWLVVVSLEGKCLSLHLSYQAHILSKWTVHDSRLFIVIPNGVYSHHFGVLVLNFLIMNLFTHFDWNRRFADYLYPLMTTKLQ
jgi:hypothetical protein